MIGAALRLAAGLVLALAAVLITASLWLLPPPAGELSAAVTAALPQSGVTHPVTAVLLNFRAVDTLLEVAVLLVALLGAHSATRPERLAATPRDPVLDVAARVLVPMMVLVGVYLLWAGSKRPGGAFHAAAVMAAGGVLLVLAGMAPRVLRPSPALRAALVLGPVVFLAVAVSGGATLLVLPPARAGTLIVLVESALTVSLALVLWALYLCLAAAPSFPGLAAAGREGSGTTPDSGAGADSSSAFGRGA